jgi:threonine dehydratase
MEAITLAELESAAELVHRFVPPTPQFAWPLLARRAGCEVWVKHENHTPTGAFKVRGGIVYMDWLSRAHPEAPGVISATRGNHGQSLAFAARQFGKRVVLVVPHGNSVEKNAAMEALGSELIVYGRDFQEGKERVADLESEYKLRSVSTFERPLVVGVGTYALELFRGAPQLDAVYVPIGQGSGICGVISARNALGRKTAVIGVVSAAAPSVARSFAARQIVDAEVTTRIADGLACRRADAAAMEVISREVDHIVEVTDDEVEAAMRALFSDTHNVAEGGGAAAFAALLQERERVAGRRVAVVLSGGNVDRDVFARVLNAG